MFKHRVHENSHSLSAFVATLQLPKTAYLSNGHALKHFHENAPNGNEQFEKLLIATYRHVAIQTALDDGTLDRHLYKFHSDEDKAIAFRQQLFNMPKSPSAPPPSMPLRTPAIGRRFEHTLPQDQAHVTAEADDRHQSRPNLPMSKAQRTRHSSSEPSASSEPSRLSPHTSTSPRSRRKVVLVQHPKPTDQSGSGKRDGDET